MHFRKNMGCLSQKMSPLEVISTDQWNLLFLSAFLEQRMNKYGMIKLVEQRMRKMGSVTPYIEPTPLVFTF